ncbi:homoserine O-acetyltransferase [Dissulfurirhabdus thermomarina]|uniref:Homoserine O-acetyltransferase n=1 Tax=Dissulfurirhabdus thermomarina TaxID=1765737 RepID=A0A6N9TP34_DISTH|nr:homoserine O-acetyltransferase [Dissulfurirhabdus thermomarina]NDY41853.1 homoserine O-acetyltransferase [Dissulfurirhabdus thermomarina]NMX22621.1 homoserine O-acetyltransferase [Dissulfurirhabdus thermomarina]
MTTGASPRLAAAATAVAPGGSVGRVRTRTETFDTPAAPFRLECGARLNPVTVAYETYGRLAPGRRNAVLVCHALSGDAHAAGFHRGVPGERPGWWDLMIGPGKPLDTRRYFVICSNFLGGCAGTTGPASIDPATGRPYGPDFPAYTIGDQVELQARLLDRLGIPRLLAVIGGSMGGMQALEWAVRHPARVAGAVALATAPRLSPQAIAFHEVARQAIFRDPGWRGGRYEAADPPRAGLALARMIGHITYLSEEAMVRKFARRGGGTAGTGGFEVERYLHHQGRRFVDRFDANTFVHITRAMDRFDLAAGRGSLEAAFRRAACRFLVVSFSSDWLFPAALSEEMVRAMRLAGREVSYCEIRTHQGHDAFLLPGHRMGDLVAGFLDRLDREAT